MSKAVEIIDGVLFVHTRHYDEVNRVIICHQKKPFRVFSDDAEKELGRPHGEWIWKEYDPDYDCGDIVCSKCSVVIYEGVSQARLKVVKWPFCPDCGASMSASYRQVTGKLNSEIKKSKSEIVPDYRDGWRLEEGDEK